MKSNMLSSLARVPQAEPALAVGAVPQEISAPGALGTHLGRRSTVPWRHAGPGRSAGRAALPCSCNAAGAGAKSKMGLVPTIRAVSTPAASAVPQGAVPFPSLFCLTAGERAGPVGTEKKEGPTVGMEWFPCCPQWRATSGWFCCVLLELKEMLSAPSSYSPVILIIIQRLHSRL